MTAQQLQRRMLRRAALVESEFSKTTKGLGIAAVKYCKEKLTAELYSIPEDVNKNGEKKWRRTGHLRRSERADQRGPYVVAIVNDAKRYAADRHERGKTTSEILDYTPRNVNPIRETHWRDDLAKTFRPIERDAYRATVLALLRKGSI